MPNGKFCWCVVRVNLDITDQLHIATSRFMSQHQDYSALHVRLECKSHEKLFVPVMCDVSLQCHSETLSLNVDVEPLNLD